MFSTRIYKHSGDLGDIIYSLPVIKTYGKGKLLIPNTLTPIHKLQGRRNIFYNLKTDGSFSGIDYTKFKFIAPLLESQKYISFIIHTNYKIFDLINLSYKDINKKYFINSCKDFIDLDLFRLESELDFIYERYRKKFDVPLCNYENPWIDVESKKISEIIVSRTTRYKNKMFPWRNFVFNYGKNMIFVGLESEYRLFINRYGYIPFYKVKDAYEMASVIKGSELFIGNQSLAYSIAEALKHRTIQETSNKIPDCIFVRKKAKFFIGNKFVELQYL